jgi:hypothetical protein
MLLPILIGSLFEASGPTSFIVIELFATIFACLVFSQVLSAASSKPAMMIENEEFDVNLENTLEANKATDETTTLIENPTIRYYSKKTRANQAIVD